MKRGRPKKGFARVDIGINYKHVQRCAALNREPLDLLLERCIIDKTSHSAGMTLRRLFVLKHGLPSIQSKEFIKISGRTSPKYRDDAWKAAQQLVYNEVMDELVKLGYEKTISDICIYGIMPNFLINNRSIISSVECQQFKDAIDALRSILLEHRDILASKALN